MKEYRVYFTQRFEAHGFRTVYATDRTGAVDQTYWELRDDPAFEEIDEDGEIEIEDVEEMS